MGDVVLACRVLTGAVFLVAVVGKARDFPGFAKSVRDLAFVPSRLAAAAAWGTIGTEAGPSGEPAIPVAAAPKRPRNDGGAKDARSQLVAAILGPPGRDRGLRADGAAVRDGRRRRAADRRVLSAGARAAVRHLIHES